MFNAQAIVRRSINNATNQFDRLAYVGNNLANYNTSGYKCVRFEQMLKESGYVEGALRTNCQQGSLRITDNPYDVAIDGPGYIPVTSPDGEIQYTRDGAFIIDKDNYLVTSEGYKVLDTNGEYININDNEFGISVSGQISSNNGEIIGNLLISSFDNPETLNKIGGNMLEASPNSVSREFDGEIQQGYLEMSNVNTVSEMVNMIAISRAYEANQKVLQSQDEMLGKAVSDVGRV